MSFSINNAQLSLALEVSRACRITLYGLHYKINWDGLIQKQNIINALNINTVLNLYSSDEEQCMQDALTNPASACISCTT